MHRLVLIRRYTPTDFFWSNLIKNKKITELSVEEVLDKYLGFEGELISYLPTTATSRIQDFIMQSANYSINYVLLCVMCKSEQPSSYLKENFVFVGYDVGICEEEKTVYSSIFNEILFGCLDELISYKEHLNENFLFPTQALAESYVTLHTKLSREGKGVEDYEPMVISKIWKYTTTT